MTVLEPSQHTNTEMSPNKSDERLEFLAKIAELEPSQYTNTEMSPIQ